MTGELTAITAMVAGFTVAGISFYISTRYQKLALSFVFLGASFLSYGLAEAYYYILDSQGVDPYHTAVDILYTFYFVFAILHVAATLKALNAKMEIETIMLGIIMVSTLTGIYVVLSIEEVGSEMFVYGGLFVSMAAILAAMSLMAIIKTYRTILTKSWILIGAAIMIASLTDVWYYTQENLTGYEYDAYPIIDGLWFATDLLIIAGIIIHRHKI